MEHNSWRCRWLPSGESYISVQNKYIWNKGRYLTKNYFYNYFAGKFKNFYFAEGSPNQFGLQNITRQAKLVQGTQGEVNILEFHLLEYKINDGKKSAIVWCNQNGLVWKWLLFHSIQLMCNCKYKYGWVGVFKIKLWSLVY